MKKVGAPIYPSFERDSTRHDTVPGGLATTYSNEGGIPEAYPFRINTYFRPPTYDITIEQFEEYAFARLQLLRAIEAASMKNQREDEIFRAIKQAEDRWLPMHSNESFSSYDLEEERKRDQASHFILRLAYCTSSDNIRWFVNQETLLFRSRFHHELGKERAEFLKRVATSLKVVSQEEKAEFYDQFRVINVGKEQEEFYIVPWEDVPDLVSRGQVVLRAGNAYVPKSDLFSILVTKFRENLEFWMERTAREIPNLGDERIMPLLQMVKTTDTTVVTDTTRGFVEVGKLIAADIDTASAHFPPCMRQLYEHATREHHLKYGGRQQLGLFLKGIGLSLEEAINWWRKIFVAKSGEDGFNKNYLYNIRHNYGQEGKRANYGPQPCSKVILGTAPGAGDNHGCPFRHSPLNKLTATLADYASPGGGRLDAGRISEILDLTKSNQCQSACTRLFEYSRGMVPNQLESFAFPSKFYEASVRHHQKKSRGG